MEDFYSILFLVPKNDQSETTEQVGRNPTLQSGGHPNLERHDTVDGESLKTPNLTSATNYNTNLQF